MSPRRPHLFTWLRQAALGLLCLGSLVVLYWQWENWRSARELATARQHLIARLGTDDLLQLAPPTIPDTQNYMAIPVIESWRTTRGSQPTYVPPLDQLVPPALAVPEVKDGHLDLAAWAAARAAAGHPLPALTAPAVALDQELGDGNGLIPQLAEGLGRPFSRMKPDRRSQIEATHGNVWDIVPPSFAHFNQWMHRLSAHLCAAALAGNGAKASTTALISLRFAESADGHGLVGGLVVMAADEITFEALHESLQHPCWDEPALVRLQLRLAAGNDLKTLRDALANEAAWSFQTGLYFRDKRPPTWDKPGHSVENFAIQHGPVGWLDAGIAYYTERNLDMIGPPGEAAWIEGWQHYAEASQRMKKESAGFSNFRRTLATLHFPNLGNVWGAAASNLFHRHCLIIACSLERYRLQHGGFPTSLDPVLGELAAFPLSDPARPGHLPGYQREGRGYVLWSAGKDGKDDGGDADKDWLWKLSSETLPQP